MFIRRTEMEKWKRVLYSRKFWAAVVGLVMAGAKAAYPDLPLDGEQITAMVLVLAAYIFGVAFEDGLSARTQAAAGTAEKVGGSRERGL
jgi:hypothetical protein